MNIFKKLQKSSNLINYIMKYSIKTEKKGKVQIVTLNRPDQLNTLNLEMVSSLLPLYEVNIQNKIALG
jgi:enoyl-CoA hydratase/carnithine racemase